MKQTNKKSICTVQGPICQDIIGPTVLIAVPKSLKSFTLTLLPLLSMGN